MEISGEERSDNIAGPIAHGGAEAQPKPQDAGAEVKLKLTVIQAPLMPKPEVSRPEPLADRAALLQRLHGLRTAASNMLAAQTGAESGPAPGTPLTQHVAPPAAGGTLFGGFGRTAAASPQPAAAWPQTSGPLSPLPSPGPFAGPAAIAPTPAAAIRSHSAFLHPAHATPQPQPTTPYGHTHAALAAQPYNPPCTPSMAGLRQQELKETGGGFLTHYADPGELLATPQPAAAPLGGGVGGIGGLATRGWAHRGVGPGLGAALVTPGAGALGGAGGAAGGALVRGSTPMSDIRSIHTVARLQLLQREGQQLVAALGGGEG